MRKWAPVLRRLVPQVAELFPELAELSPLPGDEERTRLMSGVSSFLAHVADERPLVLVLDDLHWADRGTVAMLQHVARELKSRRTLVLGTYRNVEVDAGHPLTAALATLRRETAVERISLAGLDASAVGTLLKLTGESEVSEALGHAVAEETAGNPFFVREVLMHLVEEGKLVRHGSGWASTSAIEEMGIPESVREAIGLRLSRLGATCNRLLTFASAMTGGFRWEEMRAIAADPEPELLDALDEALRAHVLRETAPSIYDFVHALIRHTLYDGLSTPRRIALHQRIAESLESRFSADLDEYCNRIGHHYDQAGASAKAAVYLLMSARKAGAAYLNDEALAFYQRARRWLAAAPPPAGRAHWAAACLELHEGVADVLLRTGVHDDAQAELAAALPFAAGVPAAEGRLRRKLASSLVTQRRYGEALAAFEEAERALGDVPARSNAESWFEWVQIQIERIWMHYWQAQVAEMTAIAERAGAMIEQHATQLQLGRFLEALTALALRRDRYRVAPEVPGLAEAAVAAIERSGETGEFALVHFMAGFVALWSDDLETAREQFSISLDWTERTGDVTVHSRVLTYLAVARRMLGDVAGVRECIERVLPVATKGQMLEYIGTANANLAWVAWREGRLEEAEELARGARELWSRLPIVYGFGWAAHMPSLAVAVQQGRLADALAHAKAMLDVSQQLLKDEATEALELVVTTSADDAALLQARLAAAVNIARQSGYL